MNKIFKVIYNNAKHCYVVASEFAKSYSRGGSLTRTAKRAGKVVAAAALGASLVFLPISARAANSGGTTEGHPTQYIGNNGSSNNTVNFDDNTAPYNEVISVYGGKTDSNDASENNVTISGDVILQSVYGGYVNGSGDASYNTVTIKGGDFSNADIYGGYINGGTGDMVSGNMLVINNDISVKNIHNFDNVFGKSISASGDVSAKNITVSGLEATNITATGKVEVENIYSPDGDVKAGSIAANSIYVENITATGDVRAWFITANTLTATNQTLTLTEKGSEIGTTNLGDNGTLKVYSNAGGNLGKLTAGTVNINGGNITATSLTNLQNLSVSGGSLILSETSDLSPSTVTLASDGVVETSAGTLTVGGVSGKGTISGKEGVVLKSAINNSDLAIVAETGDITSTNNIDAKSLTATEGNIDAIGKNITVKKVSAKSLLSANSLTLKGSGSKIGIAEINNITLAPMEWSNRVPVLEADSFEYNDSTELGGNVTLDISNLTISGENPTGSMTLLQSDTANNFSGLKLKFSDSEAAVIPATGTVIKTTATNQTKETKGISFTYDRNQSVFLADSNKKVNYVFADTYKKAELGSMKWSDGGYSFSGNEAIDPTGLVVTFADSFNVEGAEDKNEGDSLDLLDLSKVAGSGKIKDSINETISLTLDDENPTSDMIFSLKRNDSIKSNSDKTKITYTVGGKIVTNATINGSIEWNNKSAYYENTNYSFNDDLVIDISGVTFTSDFNPLNNSMTLISNADGNVTGTPEFEVSLDNTTLSATAAGESTTAGGNVGFKVTGMTLDMVTVNGVGNDTIPEGWYTNSSGVLVDTGSTVLDYAAGASILTSDVSGLFTEENFIGVNDYNDKKNNKHAFAADIDKGVTLDGYQIKGVKASDDGSDLIYAVDDTKNVTKITLGSITAGNYRDMSGTSYSFNKVESIDAAKLEFTFTNDQVAALSNTSSLSLVTKASELPANIDVIYKDDIAEHTQAIDYSLGNGIALSGTLSGTLSTSDSSLNYSVSGISLDEVNIANWDDTKEASAVLDGWEANSNGVKITAESFAPTLTSGEKTILTASDNIFKDENIDENIKYKSSSFKDDMENGITLSGNQTGGVKASDDGKSLTYYAMNKDVTNISLGSMNWGEGRTIDSDSIYDFKNVNKIDTKELKLELSNEQTETLVKGSSMELLSNAADLPDGVQVTYNDNATFQSQSIDYNTSNGVLMLGTLSGTVTTSDETVNYSVSGLSLDEVNIANWDDTKEASAVLDGWEANSNGVKITAETFAPTLTTGEKTILTASSDIFKDENIDDNIKYKSSSFKDDIENGITLSGKQTGGVKASDDGKALTYYATDKTIDKFELAKWDGENASSVNSSWKLADDATVETDGMNSLPDSEEEKQILILKSDTDGYFANVTINGENAYGKKQNNFTESDEAQRVIIAGTQDKGVTLDSSKKNLVYKFGSKDVTSFKLGSVNWKDGTELLNRDKYNYSKLTALDTKDFNVVFEKPETVAANQSMTLLKANDTLKDFAATENSVAYQYEPVSGVTMDAIIRSSLEARSGKVTLSAISNKADKLTFGSVDWLDKGALIDHKTMLNNVSFDGAAVDTSKIAFINKEKLSADMKMTLVSDFDGNPGTITGSKYKVGTAYEGEGSAYMDGNNLVFKTKTGAGLSDETHTTVMAMEAGVAMLAAGNEHVGNAIEGLGNVANAGSDGVSTYASVGGASSRYETGSHVDANSWNCTLAVGKTLEKRQGSMEYGLFAEYGRGNYTLHMDGVDNAGSGNTHYTGGGLLMKWTNKHNVYTEASFRMGNMKDNASSLLHDGMGNAYGYDIKAKYRGGHIGFGKTYKEDDNSKLEIYGKYFYNQREGINFAAGADQYSMDKVRSRVLRTGFRLSSTDKKWNRYGGISYDYEFGGKANGTVNGNAVRAASIKGGTLRGEFGYCREATKTNPWKTDISLYGFTGKRNGFGGSVVFEYHF